MQIQVLGPIQALDGDGTTVALGGPRQQTVLAVLIALANETVSVDRLIDEIWGEDPPQAAKNSLQSMVSNLRKAIASDGVSIDRTGPGYALRIDPAAVDALAFSAAIDDARTLIDSDPATASGSLTAALNEWRGRPYAGLADDVAVLQAEATRLEELRLRAVEYRVEADLNLGRHGELVGELETLLDQHPLREELYRLQMLALYRSGRQAEALRTHTRLRQTLADELGIDPSPNLQHLEQQILDQDAGLGLAPATHETGSVIRSHDLIEEIGSGAFGVVFRARQESVDREVALKVIRPELASRPEFIQRFEAEAQVAASLEHPNIVPLYDFWRDTSGAYMAMRLMRGGSLAARQRDLSVEDVVRVVGEVADALSVAHAHGVVHRDVKPENVLLDDAGKAYLSDFGIAAIESRPELHTGLTRISAYTAPEQRRGEPASPASDIWSLAAMARDLIGPRADAPVTAVLAAATSNDPSLRPGSAVAFAETLAAAVEGRAAATVSGPVANPYKGLKAFQEADADVFFGRDELTAALLREVQANRFVALVGASGSGKSSAVRAGLLPALRRTHPEWFLTVMTPSRYPFDELADALDRVAATPVPSLAARLLDDPRNALGAVRDTLPADAELVVVIDQFEELFTLLTDDEERRLFLDLVADAVADPNGRTRVVATLRADYYDHPLSDPTVGTLFRDHIVPVAPMTPAELEAAIAGPPGTAGVEVERALVAQIVADLTDRPGGLPLMEYALTELFDHRDGDALTVAAYQQLGGLGQAIGRRAEREYRRLEKEHQETARQVFLRLVTLGEGAGDTRRRAARAELDELADPADVETVLAAFGRGRLLEFDHDPITRGPTVEVTHESLLTAWERLRTWIDDGRDLLRSQRRLAAAAADWSASGRDQSFLLRGARLAEVEPLLDSPDLRLTGEELEYIETSVSVRDAAADIERQRFEQERRNNRRLRTTLRGAAVLAVLLAVAGVLAVVSAANAARDRDAAELSALVSQSLVELEDRPDLALLLAAEAYARDQGFTAQRALLEALGASNAVDDVVTEGRWDRTTIVDGVEWVAEGTSRPSCSRTRGDGVFTSVPNPFLGPGEIAQADQGVVVERPVRQMVVLDTRTRTATRFETDIVCSSSLSPDGRYLAGPVEDLLHVHDARTGELTAAYIGFSRVTWAPDGRMLAKRGPLNGRAPWVWADPASATVLEETPLEAHFAIFSADGSRILADIERGTATTDSIGIFDGRTFELINDFEVERSIGRAALSRDGSVFGYVHDTSRSPTGVRNEARIYASDSLEELVAVPLDDVPAGFTAWMEFDENADTFALARTPSTIEIRSVATGAEIARELNFEEGVAAMAFVGPSRLAVLSIKGTARIVRYTATGLTEPGPPFPDPFRRPVRGEMIADGDPAFLVEFDEAARSATFTGAFGDPTVDISPFMDEGFLDPITALPDGTIVLVTNEAADEYAWVHVDLQGNEVGRFSPSSQPPDSAGELGGYRVAFAEDLVGVIATYAVDLSTLESVRERDTFTIPVGRDDYDGWDVATGGVVFFEGRSGDGNVVHLYDLAGEELAAPIIVDDIPMWVETTSDLRFALVGTAVGTTYLVDLAASTTEILPVRATPQWPQLLDDGRFLIYDESGSYQLWDIETKRQIGVMATPGPVEVPIIFPSLASDNGEVWILQQEEFIGIPLDPEEWFARACAIAGRSLTEAEWREFVPGERPYDPACT